MVAAVFTRIYDEARRVWCYRWLVAVVATAIFFGAALYILRLPNVYDAWGQIFVSKQTPLATAAQGVSLVGENYGSPYLVQRTLLNDQNLEKVIRELDPALAPRSRTAMAIAVARLRSKILVTPDQGDGFVEVHYANTDPVRARNVVQLILNQFISRNVDRSRNDLDQASKFLDSQISSYEEMITASQAKLDAFRSQHPGVALLPVAAVPMEAITEAAPSGPSAGVPTGGPPAAVASAALSPANEKIAALSARLTSLRTQYTEEYPDVVSAKRQLAEALLEREREPAQAAAAPAVASPAIAQPSRRASARPSGRRHAVPAVSPAVQAQWADLERTDEVLHANFQQLVARREAARMSQAVYGADGSGKYQITRVPVTPDFPAGPNRQFFFLLAGAIAVAGGIGAGYLRTAVEGIFVSPRELEEAFHLPVVGTVSWEPAWSTSPLPRSSRALTVAGGLGMAAVAAFALLLILDPSGGLVSKLQTAVQGAGPIFHDLGK